MNLDKLRELAEAATPGPWHSLTYGNGSTAQVAGELARYTYATARNAGVPMTDLSRVDGPEGRRTVAFTGNGPNSPDNAAYIAAASPEVVAALVRVAQAAQALVSHMDGPEPRSGLWTTLKADREALRAALAEVTR